MYSIDHQTILAAAKNKFGGVVLSSRLDEPFITYERTVEVSYPYWVDDEVIRVGILLDKTTAFGANFYYKLGVFK